MGIVMVLFLSFLLVILQLLQQVVCSMGSR